MSSPRQTVLELRATLRALTWPDGSAEKVFGNTVYVTPGIDDQALPASPPFVLINVASANPDPDDPDLLDQVFDVVLCVGSSNDPEGEAGVVGGPRSGGDVGKSLGRGILEVEHVMLSVVEKMTGADGAPILVSNAGATEVERIGESEFYFRRYQLRCLLTRQDEFPAPQNLVASVAGANVSLSWSLPPERWDRVSVYLRRASGSTPPATVGAGSEVVVASGATSVVDAPGSGTWSYALFYGYTDVVGGASSVKYSDAEVGSYRAGVVVS